MFLGKRIWLVYSDGQNLKFLIVFKSAGKNRQKSQGKTEIFTQHRFLTKSILIFGLTLKQMTVYEIVTGYLY